MDSIPAPASVSARRYDTEYHENEDIGKEAPNIRRLSALGIVCEQALKKECEVHHAETRSKITEKASWAVSTYLNLNEFGELSFHIQEDRFCKYSKHTGWHLQRGTGTMKIKIYLKNIKSTSPLFIRAVLVRKDASYRHFIIDQVCEKHRKKGYQDKNEHVLQAGPGQEGIWQFGWTGPRKSVCFDIGKPNADGFIQETVGLMCLCNDSCLTSSDEAFIKTERSRDQLLILTLETKETGMILARRNIPIWPKAIVRTVDLKRTERRKPKGGAALKNKLKFEYPPKDLTENTNEDVTSNAKIFAKNIELENAKEEIRSLKIENMKLKNKEEIYDLKIKESVQENENKLQTEREINTSIKIELSMKNIQLRSKEQLIMELREEMEKCKKCQKQSDDKLTQMTQEILQNQRNLEHTFEEIQLRDLTIKGLKTNKCCTEHVQKE